MGVKFVKLKRYSFPLALLKFKIWNYFEQKVFPLP
jgi:hypothetical protein